jgi:hypothetical protein
MKKKGTKKIKVFRVVSTPAAIKALKVQKLTGERNYAHANSYG